MNNIGIRVHASEPSNGVVGFASITFAGQFAVTGIKIREGQYGKFLCMPSRIASEGPDGKKYEDIFYPINKDIRKDLTAEVLKVYDAAMQSETRTATLDVAPQELKMDIGISLKDNATNEKAVVVLKLENSFYLEGVTVRLNPSENRLYVAMPSYKSRDGEFKNYAYPVSKEYREEFNASILQAYEKTLQLQTQAPGV